MFRCTAVVAYLFRQNKRAQAIQTRWTPRQMDMKQTVNLRTLTELSILVENKKVSESSCPRMSDHLLHMICPAGIIISIRYDPEDVFKETEHFTRGFSACGDHDFWRGHPAEVLGEFIVCKFLDIILIQMLDVCLVSDSLVFYCLWHLSGRQGHFSRRFGVRFTLSTFACCPFLEFFLLLEFPIENRTRGFVFHSAGRLDRNSLRTIVALVRRTMRAAAPHVDLDNLVLSTTAHIESFARRTVPLCAEGENIPSKVVLFCSVIRYKFSYVK